MALPAAPLQYSFSPLGRGHTVTSDRLLLQPLLTRSLSSNRRCFRVFATETTSGQHKAEPGEDTRIHWENEDEGWIGGSYSKTRKKLQPEEKKQDLLDDNFSELLNSSTDSHYQFLGVSAEADIEEIKSAYRRLSKEYHPDTTSLPLKAASEKFMKLRDIYDTLCDEEKRRFYDWTLAQETASREAEKMRIKFEDPYIQQLRNFESVPDMVDRLGGKNLELSGQAKSALTFDIIVILFSICCIAYVLIFKEPYY
ncbi:NAD(P)H-quinone oxidoreductase subunit T, chloroplastic [Heracleum sosnowskyi]|uniref:NAD(P)H-quinone oxidoreductase subunit T, chloroplastic n=1 Tax=Heracleum sosnowskyi TaxID=360622 RepID=A0AAD8JFM9_9APIA|nr:NAD(P)H-quinone oxidoreductase subunit T, chloroplastic [Heracleum sosnowskyi]